MSDSPSVRALRAIFDRHDAQSGTSGARRRDESEPAGGDDAGRAEEPAGPKRDAAEEPAEAKEDAEEPADTKQDAAESAEPKHSTAEPADTKQDAAKPAEPKHKEDTAAAEHAGPKQEATEDATEDATAPPTAPPAECPAEDRADKPATRETGPPPPYSEPPPTPRRPAAPPAPARADAARYEACFDAVSVDGVVWPSITCEVWRRSGLPDAYLAQVWDAVAPEQCAGLTRAAFVKGLRLIDMRLQMQMQGPVRRAPPPPPARP